MEQSSSYPPNSARDQKRNLGKNGDSAESKDPANQRLIADRLLAALANGNLDHLAQARKAFLKEAPAPKKKEPAPAKSRPVQERVLETRKEVVREAAPDLASLLDRRTTPRSPGHSFAPVDELRKEEEELKRAEAELERRRFEVEAARKRAEEEAKRRVFEDTRRQLEIEAQLRAEAEERRRVEEETRRKAEEEARRRAEEEAQMLAAERARRLAEEEAQRRADEEAWRQAEEAARLRAEEEARVRAQEHARMKVEQEERDRIEAENRERAGLEARIRAEIEAKIRAEEQGRRQSEDSRRQSEEAHRRAEHERIVAEEAAKAAAREQYPFEIERSKIEDSPSLSEAPKPKVNEIQEWFEADLANRKEIVPVRIEDDFLGSRENEGSEFRAVSVPEENFGAAAHLPSAVTAQLRSNNVNERVGAVANLPHIGGEDAYRHITAAFDDSSTEVRSAAARALFDLQEDRAAAFTRALREATPDRRRKIGAAIASSGLANEAIRNLTGESRDKTYDAFSLLFLMSKAGEVQSLMRAIEEHPNIEVRLAVVKLLALSGQPDILPSFRRMAVRGSLPPEVRSAVMEAIYQITSQSPAEAQSTM